MEVKEFVLSMNNLISEFQEQSISSMSEKDIDAICSKMSYAEIGYDERSELFEYLELKKAGLSDVIKTDERYVRYLRGIDIWEIDGVSYEYIKNNIQKYLNVPSNEQNLMKKLKWMRIIDKQLQEVIQDVDNV
jgi:hypothetical protein